ncbi:MAG: RNA polymerase sigma factor [Bacteroidota bacterium]
MTLIRNHTHQLIAFAKSFTKNLSDAEDLYQDTVFLVLKNKDKFSEGTNFLPWVKTIMRNTFINHYRKNKRHQLAMTTAGSGFFFKQQHTGNPTESQIAVQDIYQLIDGVPKIYRIPFLMCYVGYSYEEIAQQIKVPAGTVKSRIYYARQHLRNAYREMEVE